MQKLKITMDESEASRNQLNKSEYQPYYEPYIGLVNETDILDALHSQPEELNGVLMGLSNEQACKLHAPYTWSIKQVLGHCIDNERVFGYRVSRFASGDETELPGYEQNEYVANMDYENCSLSKLQDEFIALRNSNQLFLSRLADGCWDRSGTCDGKRITVRAIAFLLVGHLRHHLNIVQKRLTS